MKTGKRSVMVAVAGTMVLALGIGAGLAFGDTQVAELKPEYGPAQVEDEDPNRQYRAMPALQHVKWTDADGAEQKRFVRSFLISPDGQPPVKSRVEYQDADKAWQPALDARTNKPLMESADAQNMAVNNVFNNSSGDLEALELQARNDSSGRYFYRWTSGDGGVSWTPSKTKLDMNGGAILAGAAGQSFQRVITLPDGSHVVPFYAAYKDAEHPKSASHLLAENGDGAAWKRVATVFKSSTNTYNESAVTLRADGKLLMISRYEVVKDGLTYSKLVYRVTTAPVKSADDLAKAAWGDAKAVVVPGAVEESGARGVAPTVHTMKNGVLMLVFGRPGNKIAFSHDGGASWTSAHDFYRNIPTNCGTGYKGHPCSDLGSSGYMGVAVTSPTSAYIMGDNCQSGWGCGGDYSYPHGTTDRLWLSLVTLK